MEALWASRSGPAPYIFPPQVFAFERAEGEAFGDAAGEFGFDGEDHDAAGAVRVFHDEADAAEPAFDSYAYGLGTQELSRWT